MPMTLAVPKNNMLRYNATCTNCGESYIFTDSIGNIIKSNNEYDWGICNAKKPVIVHKFKNFPMGI
jgi:hypothetical protein